MAIATAVVEDAASGRFTWVPFYEAVAQKLLTFRDNRTPLVEILAKLHTRTGFLKAIFQDEFADGSTGPLRDVSPFAVLAAFNCNPKDEVMHNVAVALASALGVARTESPTSFRGIPKDSRGNKLSKAATANTTNDDIETFWVLFSAADKLVNQPSPISVKHFVSAFDHAHRIQGIDWVLTFGLFWSHPLELPSFSTPARHYIKEKLAVPIQGMDGAQYLDMRDRLKTYFSKDDALVRSFPDLCRAAWEYKDQDPEAELSDDDSNDEPDEALSLTSDTATLTAPSANSSNPTPYAIGNIMDDGCFLEPEEVKETLAQLATCKNLILQGPPGTGKTWLARRLAYALVKAKDDTRVRRLQFHANSSYEDLVCGYRPGAHGELVVEDGPILQAITQATQSPNQPFVLVIEEFNRGNPAHIFGELLTLLETSQRNKEHTILLTYPDANHAPRSLFIPDNFYLIGTMNVADRSLAALDYALRRRFTFINLEPRFNQRWEECLKNNGIGETLVGFIHDRIEGLNNTIRSDKQRLGPRYVIGHSYFTPHSRIGDPVGWFTAVVKRQIGPLLDEYWFDEPDKAHREREQLLAGWPPA